MLRDSPRGGGGAGGNIRHTIIMTLIAMIMQSDLDAISTHIGLGGP